MSNINVVRKNLGPVTAYKYAVQQGYTGTEQEFAALMTSYATVAEEAEAAKDDAVIAKTAAEEAQAAAEAAAEQAQGAIEVDDTLSVKGRAADAKVTGNAITRLDNVITNEANLINYNYGLDYHRLPDDTKTNSLVFGIDRNKSTIKITNNVAASDYVRVRINNDVVSYLGVTNNIHNLSDGVALKTGHRYKVELTIISGTYTAESRLIPPVSVYKKGTATTAATEIIRDETHYINEFVANGDYYNFFLYIQQGTILNECVFLITLKDITKEIDQETVKYAPFSAQWPYSVGDYVYKDRAVYLFTTAHTGEWDESDCELIKQLNSNVFDSPVPEYNTTIYSGNYESSAINSSANLGSIYTTCVPGERLIITRGIKSVRFRVMFTASKPTDGVPIIGSVYTFDNFPYAEVVAPETANYVYVYAKAGPDPIEVIDTIRFYKQDFNERVSSLIKANSDIDTAIVVSKYVVKDINTAEMWKTGGLGSNGENYIRNTSIRTITYYKLDDYLSFIRTSDWVTGYLCLYTENKNFIHRYTLGQTDDKRYFSEFKEAYPTAVYFRFEIGGVDGDISEYNRLVINGINFNASLNNENVTNIHKVEKAKAAILKIQRTSNEGYGNAALRFLFITDIHAEQFRLRRCIKLVNDWGSDFIQLVVNGGDTVRTKITDGIDWYNAVVPTCNVPILNTVGNHDSYYDTNGTKTDRNTVYNTIISPLKTNVPDIVQPEDAETNGLNYYYYDADSIRFIIIDCMFWDSGQRAWFAATLDDARINSKSVICVSHYPFNADYTDNVDCVWTPKTFNVGGAVYSINDEPAIEVNTFLNNGGTFITWLVGHSHGDTIKKLKSTYGNQFMIVLPSFANRASTLHKSDNPEDYTYDALTYFVVDTNYHLLKGMRIGANINNEGTEHNGFVIDYVNGNLISAY